MRHGSREEKQELFKHARKDMVRSRINGSLRDGIRTMEILETDPDFQQSDLDWIRMEYNDYRITYSTTRQPDDGEILYVHFKER